MEENVNPQLNYQSSAQESILISNTSSAEEVNTTTGEGKKPNSSLTDENCKALAFPYLLPTGKYGYTVKWDIKLSPVTYFNQRLLNFTQIFSSEAGYIFYSLSVTQQLNPVQDGRGGKKPHPPTSFSPVTSTNVGFGP